MKRNRILIIIILVIATIAYFSILQKNIKYLKKSLTQKINILDHKIEGIDQKLTFLLNQKDQKKLEEIIGNQQMEKFVDILKVYDTYDKNGLIKMVRIGSDFDGGYVVPEIALKNAQALMGYGIRDDISFEEQFSDLYHKESYGFDCTTKRIKITNKLTHFIPECIGTKKFIEGNDSNYLKISSFSEQLKNLKLEDKNLFIKMDIEGAEYETFFEILNHSNNITGIAIEFHFADTIDQFNKAIELLSSIEKNFILVHVHGVNCTDKTFVTNNSEGNIPRVLELSFINKSLVSSFEISSNQSHPTKMDGYCSPRADYKFKILK